MADRSATILPRFLSEGVIGNLIGSSSPISNKAALPEGVSRGFEYFVQSLNKARTKHYESQMVQKELQTIQTSFTQPNLSMTQIRDYLCRLIYCDMLGYDVSFGCIHAIKLAQQGSQINKKAGYLACCLLMHRDHELILLLVNTIQKDLKSSNILDNMTALSACSQLVPVEMIPSVLPLVLDKLKHSRELVRHKAVLCLHQFQLLAPELLEHCHDSLKRALFDKDPGVMAASIHIVQCSVERDASKCRDLAESLVSILNQILSRRVTSMFEYHSVPFPWLQIQILKCLSMLATAHEGISENLIPVLKKILQASSIRENVAFSILYECIRCIVNLKAPKYLLDDAAQHVERFLLSNHPNLKFIGVKLLLLLVQVNPEYSVNYQQLIVKSLENGNLNIQKKMHKLLYQIANDSNVQVVCSKLLLQLKSSADKFWRSEVISMIIDLVERFDGDVQWQVETVFSLLQQGGDVVHDKALNDVMNVLENKFIKNCDKESGQKLLVQRCVRSLVSREVWSSIHVSAWVLGELSPFLKNMPDDKVISLFTQHLTNEKFPYVTHSCIVTALQQLVVKGVVQCETMATKIREIKTSDLHIVIKQRLSVLLGICTDGIIPSCHANTSDLDTTLTFLDELVCQDLEKGGAPFIPVHLRHVSSDAVALVTANVGTDSQKSEDTSSAGRERTASPTSSTKTTEEGEGGLRLSGVKKVWSKQGRLDTASGSKLASPLQAKDTVLKEEDLHEKELASALFGGFQNKEKQVKEEEDDSSGFNLNVPDRTGWRSLHASAVQAKTLPEPSASTGHLDSNISLELDSNTSVVQTSSLQNATEVSRTDDSNDKATQDNSCGITKSSGNFNRDNIGDYSNPSKHVNYTKDSLNTVTEKENDWVKTDSKYGIQKEQLNEDDMQCGASKGSKDTSELDLDQVLSALLDSHAMVDTAGNDHDVEKPVFQFGMLADDQVDRLKEECAIDAEQSLYSGYQEFETEIDSDVFEDSTFNNFDQNISLYSSDT